MRIFHRLPCLLSVLLLIDFSFISMGEDCHFTHLTKENSGLSYNGIKTIMQDSRGYVWVGTNKGLSRWDGARFKNYSKEFFNLESDFVCALHEDKTGNVWIGTDKGVSIYSYVTDSFTPLGKLASGGVSVADKVFSITSDSNGDVWIGTRYQGLLKYDYASGMVSCTDFRGEDGTKAGIFYSIEFDNRDNAFIYVFGDNLYYRSKEGQIRLVKSDNPSFFAGDSIEGIIYSNGYLYVASKRHGLCELNLKTQTVRVLCTLPSVHRPISLFMDHGRYLWMGTTCGLVRHDLVSGSTTKYVSNAEDDLSLSDNHVSSVTIDRSGGLWVGTLHCGIDYFSPSHNLFHKVYMVNDGSTLKGVMVRNLKEDRNHTVWIATEREGLLEYFPDRDEVVRYDKCPSIPTSITSLSPDGEYLWIGSQNGIFKLSPSSGKLKEYSNFGIESFDADNRVVTLFLSSTGDLYAGTTIGVMKYDRSRDTFSIIKALGDLTVENFAEDGSGILWLASYSCGVTAYDPAGDVVVGNYPVSGMTSSICVDNSDDVWVIGFSDGIFRYDRSADDFLHVNRANLPLLPSDVYFWAFPDSSGNLWMSSDSGLVEYNPEAGSVKVFTIDEGLLENEFQKSALKLSDGSMIFGSRNGFVHFYPQNLINESRNVSVAITDYLIKDKSCSPGDGNGINVDVASKLVFSPSQSSFGFRFSTMDVTSISYGRLLCKLDGYDNEWHDVLTDKSISYYNVPSGTYKLMLKIVNSDGISYQAHEDLQIIVEPKFWQSTTGLMLLLMFMAIAAGLVYLFFYERGIAKERKKQEEYERERDAELYNEKLAFFSNIVHEIKTPLTLIQTPLANILAHEHVDESLRHDLNTIGNSTEYMDHLVKELLEFVRVEKHGYDLVIKTIDIVEKIGFMCSNFVDTAKSKNVKLKYRHDEDCIYIDADEAALNKILNNLLHNAVKYAETFIDVHVYQENDKVSVSIRNDGNPIPEKHRNEIFKPFVQFSSDVHPYSQSFGIGLSLAKTFAEMHNGTLFLDTDTSCTKFVLRMPARVGKAVRPGHPSGSMDDYMKSSTNPAIVVAEDNKDLSDYLNVKLRDNFRVLTVPCAEDALVLLKKYNIDLLITDIALQNMSGVELCHRVSSDFDISHVPIIVMSAISSVDTKIACMDAGASIYIEKPFNLDYLLSCIRGILERRKNLKKNFENSTSGNFSAEQYNLLDTDSEFLRRLDAIVQENLGNAEYSTKQMGDDLFVTQSTLNRKVKALLNTTPNDYLRLKRLSVAASLLEKGDGRINEICYAVGFNTPSYFAKCFKNQYGVLPAEYREHGKSVK